MKAKLITYSRLISKGNFENAKIEIQLEVEENEKASAVFEAAKQFVEKRCAVEKISEFNIEAAKKIIDDKFNHTLDAIKQAEDVLSKIVIHDDLPFKCSTTQ